MIRWMCVECDFCGKEIDEFENFGKIYIKGVTDGKSKHICGTCYNAMERWIKKSLKEQKELNK